MRLQRSSSTIHYAVTTAVGMATLAAVVSLLLALGFQPLPFLRPEQLVIVWRRSQVSGSVQAISGPDITDFAAGARREMSALGGFSPDRMYLAGPDTARAPVARLALAPEAFRALEVRVALGRGFQPSDPAYTAPSAPALISYRLWQTRYGGSAAVIGRSLSLVSTPSGKQRQSYTIVGVLPPRANLELPFFDVGGGNQVWCLLPDLQGASRRDDGLFGVGRLRPHVSAAQAQAALTAISGRLAQTYSYERHRPAVVEGLAAIAQAPARRTMGLLAMGVGLVFLVACANVAVLMLAEGNRRRHALAMRWALGASRWRLWREAAIENAALTSVSLGLGVGAAWLLLPWLARLAPLAGISAPLLHPPSLNWQVVGSFAFFAVLAALAWSALLVRGALHSNPAKLLADACGAGYLGASDAGPGAIRWRLLLLAGQVAVGVALLAATALTARTYAQRSAADLGPNPGRTVLFRVWPAGGAATTADFKQQVLVQLSRLPNVQALALADSIPPASSLAHFYKSGDAPSVERAVSPPQAVTPGFFHAFGVHALYGRLLTKDDDRAVSAPAVVINLAMARLNWTRPQDAIGARIAFDSAFKQPYVVVGVASNFTGYWRQQPFPMAYLPESQSYFRGGTIVLRTALAPSATLKLARQVLASLNPEPEISEVTTMQASWQAGITRPLARMYGMGLLGLLGLALCAQGVYAAAIGIVTAQRRSLAVRSVLGAPRGRLAWEAIRGVLLAVASGGLIGCALAIFLIPGLAHWMGVEAHGQTVSILAAALVLVLATGLGCCVPAFSATRANPAEALRLG